MTEILRVPAFVDIHVHFRDPGFPEKENIGSGIGAAIAGGYRAVCMMPNTLPAIDNTDTLLNVDKRGRECSETLNPNVSVLATSAMTLGQLGKELVDFDVMDNADTLCKELTGHGVCGITEDGKTLYDYKLMEKVCEAAVRLGVPVMSHAEPETDITKRDIELARKTGARFHFQHVSLAESVDLIREAKAEGLPVTCETAPHYFALTEAIIEKKGANAKMNPPLRTENDRLAIIEGIVDGTIDCIATDHAPHEAAVKDVPFEEAANGIIGLETAFPVSYTMLVKSGIISLDRLIELMSTRPAEIIGLPPGNVYAELDLETPFTIDANSFRSKARNTPFDGMKVYGKVVGLVNNES